MLTAMNQYLVRIAIRCGLHDADTPIDLASLSEKERMTVTAAVLVLASGSVSAGLWTASWFTGFPLSLTIPASIITLFCLTSGMLGAMIRVES